MDFKNKSWFIYLLAALAFVLFLYLKTQNYEQYPQTIGEVIETQNVKTTLETDPYGNRSQQFKQILTIEIKNHEKKNQKIKLTNNYSDSEIADQKYRKGTFVFLSFRKDQGHIDSIKRDHWLVGLLFFFVLLIVLIGKKQGLFSLASLFLNVFLLSAILDIFIQRESTHLIFYLFLAVIPLTIFSLLFVSGWQKETLAAISATLLGTFLSFLIGSGVIVLLNYQGLRFEEMDFVTRAPQLLFLASLMIGCLGAVMDVAITIVASLAELQRENPQISKEELKESGLEIGQDIMGTMANVLLFSYVSGAIPLMIIYLRNHLDFGYAFSMILSLEIARAFIGSLGIVLTVPLTISLSLYFLKGGNKHALS